MYPLTCMTVSIRIHVHDARALEHKHIHDVAGREALLARGEAANTSPELRPSRGAAPLGLQARGNLGAVGLYF